MMVKKIKNLIEKDIDNVKDSLRDWTRSHIIEPKKEIVSLDELGETIIELWIVTENEDCAYRVTYDEDSGLFGLESELANGVKWYMGAYGTFSDAINNM